MISLIPYVRETFRRHLNPKQAVILIEFDKLKRVCPLSLHYLIHPRSLTHLYSTLHRITKTTKMRSMLSWSQLWVTDWPLTFGHYKLSWSNNFGPTCFSFPPLLQRLDTFGVTHIATSDLPSLLFSTIPSPNLCWPTGHCSSPNIHRPSDGIYHRSEKASTSTWSY